jgi:hypothetical protein
VPTPQERGAAAVAISKSPILQDAIAATQDWVVKSFNAATTAEEAWEARLRGKATEEFVAYLLAVIAMGRSETEKLIRERDKMSERRKRK